MDADAQSEAMNGRALLDHFHTLVHHNTSIFPSGAVWASFGGSGSVVLVQ